MAQQPGPPKQDREGEKTKPQFTPKKTLNQGQNNFKKRSQQSSFGNPVEVYGVNVRFTPFKTSTIRFSAQFRTNPG